MVDKHWHLGSNLAEPGQPLKPMLVFSMIEPNLQRQGVVGSQTEDFSSDFFWFWL